MQYASISSRQGFFRRSGRILLINALFVIMAATGLASQFAIDCSFRAGLIGVSTTDGLMRYRYWSPGAIVEFPQDGDGAISALLLLAGQAMGVCSGAYFYRKHLTIRAFLFPYVWERALCYGLAPFLAWTPGIIIGNVIGDAWVTLAPIFTSFSLFFVLSLFFASDSARDLVVTRFRKCPNCGYLIRGATPSACPECGEHRETIESAWQSTSRLFALFAVQRPAAELLVFLGATASFYCLWQLFYLACWPDSVVRFIYWPITVSYLVMTLMAILATKSIIRGVVGNSRESVVLRRCFRICFVPLILSCTCVALTSVSPEKRDAQYLIDTLKNPFFWCGIPIQLAILSVKGLRKRKAVA